MDAGIIILFPSILTFLLLTTYSRSRFHYPELICRLLFSSLTGRQKPNASQEKKTESLSPGSGTGQPVEGTTWREENPEKSRI